jgi:hypothetical protein
VRFHLFNAGAFVVMLIGAAIVGNPWSWALTGMQWAFTVGMLIGRFHLDDKS